MPRVELGCPFFIKYKLLNIDIMNKKGNLKEGLQLFYRLASKPDELEENPETIGAVKSVLEIFGEVIEELYSKEYYLDEEEMRERICWIKWELDNGHIYNAAEETMCALNYLKKNGLLTIKK